MNSDTIAVVVNKEWEADAVLSVLISSSSRPANLAIPVDIQFPLARTTRPSLTQLPRLIINQSGVSVACWCLDDLIPPGRESSDSNEKTSVLESLLGVRSMKGANCVIAVGTAGWPTEDPEAGAVVVGSRAFVCDPAVPAAGELFSPVLCPMESEIDPERGLKALRENASQVRHRFLPAPRGGLPDPNLYVSKDNLALSFVNVNDQTLYGAVADQVLAHCATRGLVPNCLDTTLGLISRYTESNFVFIAGISDRLGHFVDDVTPRQASQRFVASYNAGIVLAWFLALLLAD